MARKGLHIITGLPSGGGLAARKGTANARQEIEASGHTPRSREANSSETGSHEVQEVAAAAQIPGLTGRDTQGRIHHSRRAGRAGEAGLRSQEAQASEILGFIATRRKDYAEARAHFKESVRDYQEIGATFNVILEKSNLAHLERQLGNYAGALEYYRETIVAFRDIAQTGAVSHQLECFGFIALAQNQYERALQLLSAANALREKGGTPMTPDEQIYFDAQLEGLREKIDSRKFDSIWLQGRAMTMELAIAYALEPDSGRQG